MIPVNEPDLNGNEALYLSQCIETGWVSSDGPFVKKFELNFSKYIGLDFGVAVSSGTAALETALYAIGISEGDEVIMPAFTIISCAVAVVRMGGVPVYVDVEEDTWCINPELIEEKITSKTKCILVVHMYGHPADMDPINKIANKHDLIILEDAAEVHGARYNDKKCGSLGDISIFSFYANKIISTGEGGMVLTSNVSFAERAKDYRNLCFDKERRYIHKNLGYNFRMTNMQAALGVAQLERIEYFLKIKRKLGQRYIDGFNQMPGIRTQIQRDNCYMVYWMYCIILDEKFKISITDVMSLLKNEGIGSRAFFTGLHKQPALSRYNQNSNFFPVTDRISERGMYLPSGLTLKINQVDTVVNTLIKILKQYT